MSYSNYYFDRRDPRRPRFCKRCQVGAGVLMGLLLVACMLAGVGEEGGGMGVGVEA